MRILKQSAVFAITVAAALMSSAAWADNASPVGLWRSVDDVSGKPRAAIRITESKGVLQGRIEKAFPAPNEDANPKCLKCEGALKNAPVVGLVHFDRSEKGRRRIHRRPNPRPGQRTNLSQQNPGGRGRQEAQRARLHRCADAGSFADLGTPAVSGQVRQKTT